MHIAYQPYQIKKPQNLANKSMSSMLQISKGKSFGQDNPKPDNTEMVDEKDRRNKLKLFPQKQQHSNRFQGARPASLSLTRNTQQYDDGTSASLVQSLQQQLDQMRRQLAMKDRQMQQLNLYVQEVLKENSDLNMRLQFEQSHNQMLVNQLNQIRARYFRDSKQEVFESKPFVSKYSIQQPRKPSGRIDQKLKQKDVIFDNQSEDNNNAVATEAIAGQSQVENYESPRFNDDKEEESEVLSSSIIKPSKRSRRPYQETNANLSEVPFSGKTAIDPETEKQQRSQSKDSKSSLTNQNIFEEAKDPHIEINDNQLNSELVYQAQQVNSFIPPTRASQGLKAVNDSLRVQQRSPSFVQSQLRVQGITSKPMIRDHDFSFDEKMQTDRGIEEEFHEENHSYEEEATYQAKPVQVSKKHQSLISGAAFAEAQRAQLINEKIKINKVNEMDIKVSRFERSQRMLPQYSQRLEDAIPNEEPLIQIRQFSGGNAAQSLGQLPVLLNRHLFHNRGTGQAVLADDYQEAYDHMSELDHSGIQMNPINYPRINMSSSHVAKSKIQSQLQQVLNRNVFNNQRRINKNIQVQQLKPKFQHKNIRQPIIEEEKEHLSDIDHSSQEADLLELEQSNRIKPKLTHGQHYVQQQHYLRQQVDPILSVKGDKGNTVLDIEEIEDIEQRLQQYGEMSPVRRQTKEAADSPQGRVGRTQEEVHSRQCLTLQRPNDEQIPDFFENIDNIDVNIEETFSARQQHLYIQNFSNLGNLSQLRFQRGIGAQNRSNRHHRRDVGSPLMHRESYMNGSFSQLSQIGENLAEQQENQINQIRISNKNLTNHQMLNQNSAQLGLHMIGQNQTFQRYLNPTQGRGSNSSRLEEIARERRSRMSEITVPSNSQIQRLHQRDVRAEPVQAPGRNEVINTISQDSIGNQLMISENEDLISDHDQEMMLGNSIQMSQRHRLGLSSQLAHFGQHQQRLQNRNLDLQRQVHYLHLPNQGSENLLNISQQNSANRRNIQQFGQRRQMLAHGGGQMVGISGPVIRGEGMMQFDDMGLDEYDVADERQHEIGFDRWEINLDNMTYEELLELQTRIGYVNKGLDLDQIKSFPQMTKGQLRQFLKEHKRKIETKELKGEYRHPMWSSKSAKNLQNHHHQHTMINTFVREPVYVRMNKQSTSLTPPIPNVQGIIPQDIHQQNIQDALKLSRNNLEEIDYYPSGGLPILIENTGLESLNRVQNNKQTMACQNQQIMFTDQDQFMTERLQNDRGLKYDEQSNYRIQSRSSGKQSQSKSSSMIKVDDCAICFENIDEDALIKVLEPCNHYFHNDCINQWLIIEKRCPMCMQGLRAQDRQREEELSEEEKRQF